MRVYYQDLGNNEGRLIATHEIKDAPDPSVYGNSVKTFDTTDKLVYIGDAPTNGGYDARPIAIPTQSLQTIKEIARKAALSMIAKVSDTIISRYTPAEILSWSTKEVAARAYLAGQTLNDTQKALLQSELAATGGSGDASMKTLCSEILEKAGIFAKISGSLAGYRILADTEIEIATTALGVDTALAHLTENLKKVI